MKILLENADNVQHSRSNSLRLFVVTTSLNVFHVIDSNEMDTTAVHAMVKGQHVRLQFLRGQDLNGRWNLNLTLESALFPKFNEKFQMNFSITGEITLKHHDDSFPGGWCTVKMVISKDLDPIKDGDKYTFQKVKLHHDIRHVVKRTGFLPILTKIKLCFHSDTLEITRKILTDGISTDVTIIASNGAQIKCHNSFLIAHSSMFETMLNSEMIEATTGVIKMPTVSEPGVRSLLADLYYWELKEASSNSELAVELFKIADCYDIPRLEKDISNLLLNKPAE